jgi:maltooligosyltrehalose synthase
MQRSHRFALRRKSWWLHTRKNNRQPADRIGNSLERNVKANRSSCHSVLNLCSVDMHNVMQLKRLNDDQAFEITVWKTAARAIAGRRCRNQLRAR